MNSRSTPEERGTTSGRDGPGAWLFELDDFGPSEAVERFRDMGLGTKE